MYKSPRSGSNWTPSLMSKPPLLWGISTELLSTRCHRFVLILWSQSSRILLYHRPARLSILPGRFSMQQHSCPLRIYAPWHVFFEGLPVVCHINSFISVSPPLVVVSKTCWNLLTVCSFVLLNSACRSGPYHPITSSLWEMRHLAVNAPLVWE